jgi:hypothetical protein
MRLTFRRTTTSANIRTRVKVGVSLTGAGREALTG